MNNEAKKKAEELIWLFYETMNPLAPDMNLSFNQCKQCALKVAKSEWEVLEQARVFEQHEFYLELFKEIENYG